MEPVTWSQFTWIVGGLITLNVGVFAAAWAMIRGKAGSGSVERLWSSHNADVKELAAYKTEVAKDYPTKAALESLEIRLLRHFDEKIGDLKEFIREDRKAGDRKP